VSNFHDANKIKTAFITGRHPFDIPGLYSVFKSIPEIDFYPQHLEDFISDTGKAYSQYDVIVFYNFHQETPGNEQNWWDRGTKDVLERLGETQQGILLLHHAILAFPKWDFWADLCGIKDRKFGYHVGQTLKIDIANADHPITKGLNAWEMVDETYQMNDAGSDCDVLLTTDHPKSMKTIAWTRQFRNAKVLCLQSGHDNQTYADQNFGKVISKGVKWLSS
jgi:trehalose utilization protein